jgi:hypothetical protein
MGNRPNTSIENKVKEKTCVVDGSREASTADAIIAEFVEIEAGSLHHGSVLGIKEHICLYIPCSRAPTIVEKGHVHDKQPRAESPY